MRSQNTKSKGKHRFSTRRNSLSYFENKWMEEPEAIRKFGTEYLNYKQHTPWFCFKRECLRELFKKVEK